MLIIREKIYCIGLTHGLDDTTLTGEAKNLINFTETRKRFVLSLDYIGSNSFLFLNATKVYQFKAKNSEIKENALCLGNVSKDFRIKKMYKKTRIKGVANFFSVDFHPIDINDFLDIHKYLMKRTWYEIMFRLIKKIFNELLTGLVNGSNDTKCDSLSNQKWKNQPTLINLHPNEYSQEFNYYSFAVKLDRCAGSCNTINDLSNKVCIPNKTEDLNLSVFNMITGINESKILTKHLSC